MQMSTVRANAWSVTINNPTLADDECLALAEQKGWKIEGQFERGKEGTPHYQMLVRTPQIRWSAMTKAFPRGHIEVARNIHELRKYVTKEETREGELPSNSELYPSLQKMWDMFYDFMIPYMEVDAVSRYSPEERLAKFDLFIGQAISKGFVVETMGVNPQMRSCVKLYLLDILERSKQRRQTDRQTDREVFTPENNVAVDIIQYESEVEETTSSEEESTGRPTIETYEEGGG